MLNIADKQPFPLENEVIEYKEKFNEKCKKEIAAFLNGTRTAYIYFGVNDDSRKVTHVYTDEEKHKIEEQVGSWLSSSIYYPSPVGVVHVITDQVLFCIEINPGNAKPYFLDSRAYVRNGSESVKASQESVAKMMAFQDLSSFDASESPIQNLNLDEIESVFKRENLDFKAEALGFLNPQDLFTNVAFLMSSQNNFLVKVAIFDGVTVDRFKDRREFSGCLPKQIDDILTYIDLNNPLSARITGKPMRDEKRSYPSVAIRESVINAIVHRSYFSKSPIQIEIFDDRLTIMSPGPLPGGMKLKTVLAGRTLPRNPQVIKVLNKLKYIEDYGTGIRRILNSYAGENKEPDFKTGEDFVKVSLPNLNYSERPSAPTFVNVLETDDTGTVKIVDDETGQVVEYLKNHLYVTRAIVELLLGVKGTQANKYLKKMVDANILKKVGAGPATRYVLVHPILSK
ncbi:ATP-binding protein [Companilactobacillus nodensis]|uniref:Transcriptional regulator n=1 Tax=Companilactobacillus nodensis DSM 19682 = JCM 14932 = NBRC 107160 TaxID=1423775 RepID=A0A0R1KGF9_9LACO|nr:ATP-binding protein [Companilactobacillus nodensis]KRK79002.1 transcriptional regulator [Companilactobacillus nodensis DSM 19682 = JCM 14932 = NBRC 107160]